MRQRRWMIPVALAVLLALAVVWWWSGSGTGDDSAVPPLPVSTIRLDAADGYSAQRAHVGSVRADRRTDAAFDLAGRVVELAADDGEAVDAGRAMARLETDRLDARIAELEAAADAARANLSQRRNAERRLAQARELDPDAVGELALDDARDGVRAAGAEVERVEHQLERVRLDVEKSTLLAPFDGLVERRHVDSGAIVAAGTPVFTLIGRSGREARIGFSANVAERLVQGEVYSVRTGAAEYDAEFLRLLPREDARLRTVEALFRFPDDAAVPRPGDLATVMLSVDYAEPGFWIPLDALTASVRGLWAVYAAVPADNAEDDAMHILRRHEVEVLYERDDRVFVRSTLSDGDRIVADGLHRLTPGLAVRLTGND
jgi:RND family efflux transporter MFP subunit